MRAALTGKMVSGAEAELQAASGVDGIPMELWDVPRPEQRNGGAEHRAITPAPGTDRDQSRSDPAGRVRAEHRQQADDRHAARAVRDLRDRDHFEHGRVVW